MGSSHTGGLQAANGSGKRGLGAGGEPSGSQRTCARSYWQLNLTKPKAGRHGARGAGWQNKCPFWMSSTQWGKVETVGDEGAVSGYTCGAWATACALLWACGGLCKGTQISASRRGACVLICIYATDPKKLVTCPAQHRAYEFFLFALPPIREWVRLIRGDYKQLTGAGSGGWEQAASRLVPNGPVRALICS